jgi:hypothetical protein
MAVPGQNTFQRASPSKAGVPWHFPKILICRHHTPHRAVVTSISPIKQAYWRTAQRLTCIALTVSGRLAILGSCYSHSYSRKCWCLDNAAKEEQLYACRCCSISARQSPTNTMCAIDWRNVLDATPCNLSSKPNTIRL